MFLVRLEPDRITLPDLFDRPAFALDLTEPGRDQKGLAERMSMPCGSRARLELGNSGLRYLDRDGKTVPW